MTKQENRRVLIIDDNESIHDDFRKILAGTGEATEALLDAEAALFGDDEDDGGAGSRPAAEAPPTVFEIEAASQGQEALEKVQRAREAGHPFAMAFVDMRMPPGWDGVQTIRHLWEADPDLQCVVCTAYADYSWTEMVAELGQTDRLLILKKPFDAIEACQLATALTEKWNVTERERGRLEEVSRAEQEARAYASSLETVNRALQAQKATSEVTTQAHSDFLRRLTAGLLGPMSTLVGDAEAIKEGAADGDWMDRVEELCQDGGQLVGTLTDMLDVTDLESGRAAVEARPCSPAAIAHRVVERFAPLAGRKGLVLETRVAGDVPDEYTTDDKRVGRVLEHLVDNAVRHTAEGSVRVEVSVDSTDSWAGEKLVYSVTDTGCGIPREKQGALFETLGERTGRTGAGMGLSLSKRLAQRLGGDLTVESTEGEGATFTLWVKAGALSPS